MSRLDSMAAAVGPRFAVVVSAQGRPVEARMFVTHGEAFVVHRGPLTLEENEAFSLARLAFEGEMS